MIQIERNKAFKVSVIAVSNGDFISPVVGLVAGNVKVYTKTEGQSLVHPYSPAGNWTSCGHGLYEVSFPATYASGLGRFNTMVTGSSILPYFGQAQVVGALPDQINAALAVVSGQVDVRSTQDIYNVVTGLSAGSTDLPIVQAGGIYDGATFALSFFLEREGVPISSPASGEFHLYDQVGTEIASGTSSSPDTNGTFRFTQVLAMSGDTLPYADCTVKDGTGRETTRTVFPVVR